MGIIPYCRPALLIAKQTRKNTLYGFERPVYKRKKNGIK